MAAKKAAAADVYALENAVIVHCYSELTEQDEKGEVRVTRPKNMQVSFHFDPEAERVNLFNDEVTDAERTALERALGAYLSKALAKASQ
jgi:hypothetical protein